MAANMYTVKVETETLLKHVHVHWNLSSLLLKQTLVTKVAFSLPSRELKFSILPNLRN